MPRLLYMRWMQWNAWTPFFLIGGHDEHRLWKFDAEFQATFRRYLWQHVELIPFFYSQHVQASLREGKLMHRGPGASEYQIGDAFLIGIMDNDKPAKEITFPEGTWLDYWDNRQEYAGGKTVKVAVPETRNPVYIRLGAIVAMEVRNDAAGHGMPPRPAGERSTATRARPSRRPRSGTRPTFLPTPPAIAHS